MNSSVALIVNPIAGVGGAAGLKGSDGLAVQQLARQRGGISMAVERATQTLAWLPPNTEVLTCSGPMGQHSVEAAGHRAKVVYQPAKVSTAEDTIAACQAMISAGAKLILFAGGDGTARDIVKANLPPMGEGKTSFPSLRLGEGRGEGKNSPQQIAVIAIPAGVKIYSPCFAISPAAAGRMLAAFLAGNTEIENKAVIDVAEDDLRAGRVELREYGTLPVAGAQYRTQARKQPTPAADLVTQQGIAEALAGKMQPDTGYVLGPGSTLDVVAARLGVKRTPLGCDVVKDGELILPDACAADLEKLADEIPLAVVLTPLAGVGFLLGRGNQQISAALLRKLSAPPIVVATPTKLATIVGPLLVDTGDIEIDNQLSGYLRVITRIQDQTLVPVKPASMPN